MERRLAAIMFADLVGYGRLIEQDEVGTLTRLKEIRDGFIEPLIDTHGGRLVKLMGDGFLVEFQSVVKAIECAIAWQQGMAEHHGASGGDERLAFRIGINLGDVIVEGGDLYGEGVNVVARLEPLAAAGGVCISEDAYRQLRGKLVAPWVDLGPQRLKNIAAPLRAYGLTLDGGGQARPQQRSEWLSLPDQPSIVVLPFDNMSGNPAQDYFSDGVVEEITGALCRVRSLFVIARNSAFAYKGRAVDVKQISRELGVRYLVEGSVRRVGDRVRITVQLIDAVNGVHVWADHYDGILKDVFELQDRVTESIVGAIEPQLRTAEIARSRRKPPDDLNAYDCFLRAVFHLRAMTRASNQEAEKLLETAIGLEPDYASAMALLAWCYCLRPAHGWVASKDREAEAALRLSRTAIDAAPDDPEALCYAGYAQAFFGDDPEGGSVLIDRALKLDPNSAQAWVFGGWVHTYVGGAEAAVAHFERAMRLSPLDTSAYRTHAGLAFAHLFMRQFDDAISWARRALQENDRFAPTHRVLAAGLAHAGRLPEAEAVVQKLQALVPGLTLASIREDTRFRHPPYFELLVEGLRLAGLPG